MSSELWDRLTTPISDRAEIHAWVGDRWQTATWREVVADAERMTAGLRRLGVGPGARVAAILTNTPTVVRGLAGVWLAGGALASLPVPARGMAPEEYVLQLRTICAQLEPVTFLAEGALLQLLPEDMRAQYHARSWESLVDSGAVAPEPPGPDELAFIQYSSGSTSSPKGCMLTPRAIAAQMKILEELLKVGPGESGSFWLPLSHDMGLFGGLICPWWNGCDLYMSTPERFTFSPGTWFGDMAEFGAAFTAGTSTALHLAARLAKRDSGRLSHGLAKARACIIGAERVDWDTLITATEALGAFGLNPNGLKPAYGLAEGTLAVTGTRQGEPYRHVSVDAIALADGRIEEVEPDLPTATRVTSAGPPLPGVTVSTLESDTDGVGDVFLRTPSLAIGYYGDEQRTRDCFRDGGLRTGDLGFLRDGHLYPVGRADDVFSIAGRKVHAREIENAIEGLREVRRGCSTLVSQHDGSRLRLTLFVEVRGAKPDYRSIAEQAASLAMAKGAVPLDECVFLERNSLPKTPSGKIQRYRCRQLFESGRLSPLATISLGGAA